MSTVLPLKSNMGRFKVAHSNRRHPAGPLESGVVRLLVIEHEPDAGAALLAERARQLGATIDVATPECGIPTDVNGFEALLVMGASPSVNDAEIAWWFEREVALLRDAAARSVPVLGVCFGAQALAVALGGSVSRATRAEIGWFEIDTTDEAVVESGPWMQWHVDAISPPPGATVLAKSDVCVQAYAIGPHLGVQFHPEVTESEVLAWAEQGAAGAGIDPAALLAQTRAVFPAARERAFRLFDRFAANLKKR